VRFRGQVGLPKRFRSEVWSIARFNGGTNADHTVIAEVKYVFHLLPSGMLHPGTIIIIRNGMVLSLEGMFEELTQVDKHGVKYDDRFVISDHNTQITPQLMADAILRSTAIE